MKKKNKEIEMKVTVLNPEELERAKEEFTKAVVKAFKESQLSKELGGDKNGK